MSKYYPRPAPKMGPKFKGTKTKDYVQTSFDIPSQTINQLLDTSLKLEPATNIQEATHSAILWFLAQRKSVTFPIFTIRRLNFDDLQSIKVPADLAADLQAFADISLPKKHLKNVVDSAISWFVNLPVEQTVKNFVLETQTIYLRGDMKKKIEAYIKELRAYSEAHGLECSVTGTKVVIFAMERYYYEYLLKQTK